MDMVDQVGININSKDTSGRTALLWAAENGHEAVVQLLLDWDAYIEAADDDGWTPLLRDAANGHAAIVRLLLDKGAHIEAAEKWDQTPLSSPAENWVRLKKKEAMGREGT
ncbi:ankyrin repeat domain-containing [Fusarium acutatum]|uniref:Ankyrin repeat domain-containing n=1 Tax=Fusarium acutatum TaxID=78861 RepID=A0A8H4NCA9_9HYPO|nr:ankyrin repeat domain-containing [Fusarium acutatum]